MSKLTNNRGLTLIELMIVVAIVGVLGAIGGVAYMKHVKSAKVGKLKQYSMEVANGQEQYKSQNSRYLDLEGTPYAEGNAQWESLLGFTKKGLADQNITIETAAGDAANDCAADICGSAVDFDGIWFAVKVTQDLNPDISTDTTVTYYTGLPEPIVANDGD